MIFIGMCIGFPLGMYFMLKLNERPKIKKAVYRHRGGS